MVRSESGFLTKIRKIKEPQSFHFITKVKVRNMPLIQVNTEYSFFLKKTKKKNRSHSQVCIYSCISLFSSKLIRYLCTNMIFCTLCLCTLGFVRQMGTQGCFFILFCFLIFSMMYMLTAHLQMPFENTVRLYRCKPKHSLSC